jgi:short-subunit dehydrogenase
MTLRVFITGASAGIGAELARFYAQNGAIVGMTARRLDLLSKLQSELSPSPEIYAADVRDANAMIKAAEHFIAAHGVPDIVIANAGISIGALTDYAEDLPVFKEVMDINVLGMVHTFHPFVIAMRERRVGTLVGICSIAGFRGLPGAGAYSASKAAAITYCESLRTELVGSGVSVVTICPGFIRTDLTAANPYPMPFLLDAPEAVRRFARAIEAGRSFTVIPWQMAILGRVLHVLPNWLFDWAVKGRRRKPRREPQQERG